MTPSLALDSVVTGSVWYSTLELNLHLQGSLATEWDDYVLRLNLTHNSDELVWCFNKHKDTTTSKLAYSALVE